MPKKATKSKEAKPAKVNKSAWIRSQPATLSAADVVEKAKAENISLSVGQVYTARSTAKGGTKTSKGSKNKPKGVAAKGGTDIQMLAVKLIIEAVEAKLTELKASVGL